MIFAYLCVNCGSLRVSSVAQYEVMNRHVYVHNNNVVRINLQMLLVKDCSRELYRRWIFPKNPSKQKQNLEGLLNATKLTRDRQLQVLAKNRVEYRNIWMTNFKRRVTAVKLTGWSRKEHEQKFIFEYFDDRHALAVYSLTQVLVFQSQCLAGFCLMIMKFINKTRGNDEWKLDHMHCCMKM